MGTGKCLTISSYQKHSLKVVCLCYNSQISDLQIDEKEKETVKWMKKALEIRLPREMGQFQQITVNASTRTITCNCEQCNKNGPRCFWVDTMKVLQFGVKPETKCQTCEDASLGWNEMIKASIENIKYYCMD